MVRAWHKADKTHDVKGNRFAETPPIVDNHPTQTKDDAHHKEKNRSQDDSERRRGSFSYLTTYRLGGATGKHRTHVGKPLFDKETRRTWLCRQ